MVEKGVRQAWVPIPAGLLLVCNILRKRPTPSKPWHLRGTQLCGTTEKGENVCQLKALNTVKVYYKCMEQYFTQLIDIKKMEKYTEK